MTLANCLKFLHSMAPRTKFGLIPILASLAITTPIDLAWSAETCEVLFSGSQQHTIIDEADIQKNVKIIWYPKTRYFALTHTKVVVGNTVWQANRGYTIDGDPAETERAAKSGGRGYVSFELKVSDGELTRIENYLFENEGKFKCQNCMSGVCSAITKNSGIVIPFPFSQVPTLAAGYLTLVNKLGYKRVTKIEWIGKNALSPKVPFQPVYEVFASVATIGAVSFLLITGYDKANQLVQYLIPILKGLGLSQNEPRLIELKLASSADIEAGALIST